VTAFLENFADGSVKLYEIYKLLKTRRENRALFQEGAYVPLEVKGACRRHAVAFARKKGNKAAVAVALRCPASLSRAEGAFDWKDTWICIPPDLPRSWQDSLTDEHHVAEQVESGWGLRVGGLLGAFPAALLTAGESQ
jgi:(1->4)-alpha-D-glucan 1-alpha-D-glucosylmutase